MHFLTSSFLAAPAAIVLSLAAASAAQQSPDFNVVPKFVHSAEATYEIEESTYSVLRAEIMEKGAANQQSRRKLRLNFKIIDIHDQGATIQGAYQAISFASQSELMKTGLSFDSEKPAAEDGANPLAPVIRPLLASPFTFQVSPGGNVSEVKFAPGVVPSIPMARMARQFMDEATMQNRLAEIFTTRSPKEGQPVGAAWSATQTLGSAAPGGLADALKITWTHTLQEADQTKAKIDVKGDAVLADGAGSVVKARLTKFDSKGTQVWEPFSGWLQSFEITTVLNAEFEPQPGVTQTIESTDIKKIKRLK
jgi:hypothetical protein